MQEERIWNPTIEKISRDHLRQIQDERLRDTVKRVYAAVPFYRNKMQELGMLPGDIHGVEDLHLLPFTYKTDLRDNYPFGLFAVPQEQVVRVHASSGTTGKPTVVGYTARDIDTWAELMARSMTCAGVTRKSMVQVSYGYGLFTGGLGAHYGAERVGASVIPMSGGNTQKQIMLMQDFKVTTLACTPSYAIVLGEALRDAGIPLSKLSLKSGIFGAEPWTEGMRTYLEELLGIKAFDVYGLSEVMGPGVSIECDAKQGMHVWEDHFLPEIVDPDTGEQLPDGTRGEICFTTITKEALPLLRYRTHDLTSLTHETCACGRTHARMTKLTGRTDDMLIIRGVNVFPSQVETVLAGIAGIAPHYMLVVDRKNNLDTLEVQVEMTPELVSDQVRVVEQMQHRVSAAVASVLGLTAAIKLVQPGTLPRTAGKATRVQDLRKL